MEHLGARARRGPLDPSWRGVPALVLHGERDDRIPLDYAAEGVAALREQGLDVRYVTVAREDHYLIFTDTPRVRHEADAWLDAVEAAPARRGVASAARCADCP